MHIAYFQNWGLGDLMMTVPAIAELRRLHPTARITLIVRGGAQKALLDGDPLVDQVLNMPARAKKPDLVRFFWSLRAQKFDVAFVGTRISPLLPALLRFVTGIRKIIGDGTKAGFLYSTQIPVVEGVHRVDRMRDAVAAWSGQPLADVAFPLQTQTADLAAADALLAERGFARGGYVMVHAGSSVIAGTDKRIPAGVVRRLIDGLGDAAPDVKLGLIFGPDEMDLVERYAPYDNRVSAFTGMPLGVTRSVLAGARIFVGTDSAPGHLAAAEGVPTITVAGPTKPLETAPWGADAHVIARPTPLDCQPCWGTPNYGNCPFGVRCMEELPEDTLLTQVLAAFAP